MKKTQAIVLVLILAVAVVGAGIFVWPMLTALSGPDGGLAPVIIMIVGCFLLGGVLMFLLFYSARKGHDADVHDSVRDGKDPPVGP